MFDLFDYFILSPLRLFFQGIYDVILIFVSNYGVGIIGLSCVTAVILIPIEKSVRGAILREKKIESILQPQLTEIKHKYNGIEKNNAIKRLYSRYGYSPLYSIRNVYGVLVQLPFLIGAYLMLSSYDQLNGQCFLFIKDLSLEDHLLGQINLLPILMTVINLSLLLFLNLSKKENIQTCIVAFAFFVLLYTAPSALLLYWSMNNLIHLFRAILKKYRKQIILGLCRVGLAITYMLQNWRYRNNYYCIKNILINQFNKLLHTNSRTQFVIFMMLILLSPSISMINNLGFYTSADIARSIIIIFIISVIVSFLFLFITQKTFVKHKAILRAIIMCFVLLGLIFYYKTTGYYIVQSLPRFYRIITIGGLLIITYILGGLKILNIVLGGYFVCCISYCGIMNYTNQKEFLTNFDSKQQIIKLNNKPNIYYILCESMTSLDIAQNTFKVDKNTIIHFQSFLKENGFYVPEVTYSNGYFTLNTMQNIFLMKDFVKGEKGDRDGSTGVRLLLGGNDNNYLLKILHYNGYHTSSYLMEPSFWGPKGKNLDYSDLEYIDYKRTFFSLSEFKYLSSFIKFIHEKYDISCHVEDNSDVIFYNYLKNEPNQPHFMFHRPKYTFHTEDEGYSAEGRKEFIPKYKEAYCLEISALIDLSKKILEKDPDAIIIMIGDHGPNLYRTKSESIEQLEKELKEANITYEDFINDKFRVFAAVRIPSKFNQINESFSPANIFSLIFSRLGYSNGKLSISQNNSFYSIFSKKYIPVIKQGKIVSPEELYKW